MSATRSKEGEGKSDHKKGVAEGLYGFFSSLRFTIFLLSFIAVASIVGTLIKQKADIGEYLSLYSQATYMVIRFFGLDDVYHAFWFRAAISCFAVNLVLCTVGIFSRFVRSERPVDLPDEQRLAGMKMSFLARGKDIAAVLGAVKHGYQPVYQGAAGTVMEKGSFSRYGVFIVHTSIIIILIGGFVGQKYEYRGSVTLRKGETKDQVISKRPGAKEIPLGFTLKCEDFKVSFYPTGEPKDYVSTVAVIERDKVVLRKEIRVNDPLNYKGIHVYQATYGNSPSFLFAIGGEQVALRERDTYNNEGLAMKVLGFESNIHNFGPGVLVTYMEGGKPKRFWFLKNVEKMRERTIQNVHIRLEDIKDDLYTGLEVSRDPGIYIVWTGFAMILLGLYVTFFIRHRRIYVRRVAGGTLVAGVARKNREAFKTEFERLQGKVNDDKS
jgi:cytochrome c biogenesis protein